MIKYSISVKWSDEDDGFIAVVNELPGVSAFGETQEEAVAELKVAAEAYLEALRESGKAIPAPEKLVPFSGQLRLRMPKSLHARLVAEAENEGVSLNTSIVSLLSEKRAEKEAAALIRQSLERIEGQQRVLIKAAAGSTYGQTQLLPRVPGSSDTYDVRWRN